MAYSSRMILCVPGFLGDATDFKWLTSPHETCAIFQTLLAYSLEEAGATLCDRASTIGAETIIGYSLGGRLALHALLAHPSVFKKAIIISAHTGLPEANARTLRKQADEGWAQRFENEEWADVIAEWNAQSVFEGSVGPLRNEKRYERTLLAHALRHWSLGAQKDLSVRLADVQASTLWITGGLDRKFTAIAKAATSRMPHARHVIVENASHRVMHDAPTEVCEYATRWISEP